MIKLVLLFRHDRCALWWWPVALIVGIAWIAVEVPVVILTGTGYGLIAFESPMGREVGRGGTPLILAPSWRGKFLTPKVVHAAPAPRRTKVHSTAACHGQGFKDRRRRTPDRPPRDFIQARNTLVERLTKARGHRGGQANQPRRRPSPVVWALTEWLRVTRMTSEPWQRGGRASACTTRPG